MGKVVYSSRDQQKTRILRKSSDIHIYDMPSYECSVAYGEYCYFLQCLIQNECLVDWLCKWIDKCMSSPMDGGISIMHGCH